MNRPLAALALAAALPACGDDTQTSASQASATTSTGATTTASEPTSSTTSTSGDATSNSGTDGASATMGATSTTSTTDATTTTSSSSTTGDTATTSSGDTTSTSGSSSDGGGSSSGGVMEACGCPDDIEVPLDDGIFVLSGDAELWKYFPEGNTFTMLGALNCGMTNTFSMAVDRLGYAWVQFQGDGELRKVDVTDVTQCTDPGYLPGQNGVINFGMAFVSNSESDACDRIYGNTYSGLGPFDEGPGIGDFITIDPVTLKLSKLGKTNFDGAEGTGTGDGRAFIFGGANPAKLVEVDKMNGAALNTLPLTGLEINNGAFAFAFFAGDFYFFTDSNNDFTASEVTRLDYDDSDGNGKQDLTLLTDKAPLVIVGAGVSTCAPTAPQ